MNQLNDAAMIHLAGVVSDPNSVTGEGMVTPEDYF